MSKAKSIMFTDNELRTIVSVINTQYHKVCLINLEAQKPIKDERTDRLLEISRKVYGELIRRQN